MKEGDKIKMIIQSTNEVRFYQVERISGGDVIFRVIDENEVGHNPLVIVVKNLRTSN